MHITAWQDDPFAHGAYAYMTVGSTTADHDDLATPVGGVLHIAGEATWTDDPATVTAALHSGHRAASNILGREIPIEEIWAALSTTKAQEHTLLGLRQAPVTATSWRWGESNPRPLLSNGVFSGRIL